MNKSELARTVSSLVEKTPVLDVHTHLYSPQFGKLLLWGIDELLTYHYLVCEVLLEAPMPYTEFWAMPKARQAEYIWEHLFQKNTPVSEATRGVVTTIKALGFDPRKVSLKALRKYFASKTADEYVDLVFEKARLEAVVMTNDVFDADEQAVWARLARSSGEGTQKVRPVRQVRQVGQIGRIRPGGQAPRFLAAMRIDGLLSNWPGAADRLRKAGYTVTREIDERTVAEVLRFLGDHADRMRPVYLAASLPPDFAYPEDSDRGALVERCILPFSRERSIPFAMMVGVKKLMNPELFVAGDGVGKADIGALERLCAHNPRNKFLVTYLSRENQHELCVVARKFHNVLVFGCWWFLNVPSVIAEMTAERMELLGPRFIPQHSDARVLDQLVYKWAHSRKAIGEVLTANYGRLIDSGWALRKADVERDVRALFSGNFRRFVFRRADNRDSSSLRSSE